MNYSMVTRARRHGIFFEHHELEPVGITEHSECWGIWVEGRGIDQKALLDSDERTLVNESPQLAISAIHPDQWPTAFNIEALITRRPIDSTKAPATCDSFLGLTDALVRCGVNILQIHTAQVGYDLISVQAICELPHLRSPAAEILRVADEAGAELQAIRDRASHLSKSKLDEALRKQERETYNRRVAAFRALGLLLMPRLAELELRLLAMDYFRSCYSNDSEESELALLIGIKHSDSIHAVTDSKYAIVTGQPPHSEWGEAERTNNAMSALRLSWYFDKKIIGAGENPYFLSYQNIESRHSADCSWPPSIPLVGRPHSEHELTDADLDSLFRHTYDILKRRDLTPNHRDAIPQSTLRHDTDGAQVTIPRSGTAERLHFIKSEAEFINQYYRDFYQRQSYQPIKVSMLPSLAHMRFWAYGGATAIGQPFVLHYKDRLLLPDSEGEDGAMRMSKICSFLNKITKCTGGDPAEPFGPNMPVWVTLNLSNHFARLRFVREPYESRQYMTAHVSYKVKPKSEQPPTSQGLIRNVSELMVQYGFRVERASMTVIESNAQSESGILTVVGRAASKIGRNTCVSIAKPPSSESIERPRRTLANDWKRKLLSANHYDREFIIDDVVLTPGFVDWDR